VVVGRHDGSVLGRDGMLWEDRELAVGSPSEEEAARLQWRNGNEQTK
jgi:hypothetical protein